MHGQQHILCKSISFRSPPSVCPGRKSNKHTFMYKILLAVGTEAKNVYSCFVQVDHKQTLLQNQKGEQQSEEDPSLKNLQKLRYKHDPPRRTPKMIATRSHTVLISEQRTNSTEANPATTAISPQHNIAFAR